MPLASSVGARAFSRRVSTPCVLPCKSSQLPSAHPAAARNTGSEPESSGTAAEKLVMLAPTCEASGIPGAI
eukprot:366336-Chlamydomonas_euryale.AAC.33